MKNTVIGVIATLVVIGFIYLEVHELNHKTELKKKIDSLESVAKAYETLSKFHEARAMKLEAASASLKKEADYLIDSISKVHSQSIKWKKLYDKAAANNVRFTSDTQRDSALAKLYPR